MYTANFTHTDKKTLFPDIEISNISYVYAANDPSWEFHLHSHPDSLELSYVFDGNSAFFYNNKVYETAPGDIIIKNSNVTHAEKSDVLNPIEQVCINIKGVHVINMPENCLLSDNDNPIISVDKRRNLYDSLFRYIVNETVDKSFVNLSKINTLLSSILEMLYSDYNLNFHSKEMLSKKDISPILRYIERHYASNLSINSIAKEFFIDPFYLSKKFKAQSGYTINQYIISCRMGEAERKLVFSDDAIKDIALSCGYENLTYFYTSFKKYAGCTPQEYKAKYHR